MTAGAERADVVVIGGGPAGLSAALNLVRARLRVVVLDANRPRHSATLVSHGFLSRDGVSPLELRRLGREDVDAYDGADVRFAAVARLAREGDGFVVEATGVRGAPDQRILAARVVLATGLTEALPAVPGIRAWYGTALHSCLECDGWEKRDRPLVLVGETADLAERALLLTAWSDDITVLTNGADVIDAREEALLAERGVAVDRAPVTALEGERGVLAGVRTEAAFHAADGGFVRPVYSVPLGYLDGIALPHAADGYLEAAQDGATPVAGIWAVGDLVSPGPAQLIVAAGHGARAAASIVRDKVLGGR